MKIMLWALIKSTSMSMSHKFQSQLSHIGFVEFDHETISTVIFSLPLIEEGQLSITGESMSTSIVYITTED